MKTFQEIFSEVVSNDFATENVTVKSPEERAAKEYAKQWIEKVVREVADVPPNTLIEMYLKEIDAQ